MENFLNPDIFNLPSDFQNVFPETVVLTSFEINFTTHVFKITFYYYMIQESC